jgi:hypothetical protein
MDFRSTYSFWGPYCVLFYERWNDCFGTLTGLTPDTVSTFFTSEDPVSRSHLETSTGLRSYSHSAFRSLEC